VRVLVWGAGAVGGSVGAALVQAGLDVTFVDTVAAHVAAMRDKGLVIEVQGVATVVPVQAFVPAELAGQWDHVLLCVKSQHTADAAAMLRSHLAEDGVVLSLQNGLCAGIVGDMLGVARTLTGFVNFGADVVAPGRLVFGNRGTVAIGELDGRMTARLELMGALMRHFEPDAILTPDIQAYVWGKLAYASLLFAQALGDAGIADCLARPELAGLWARLTGEVLAVARAVQVQPRGFNGFDPEAFGENGTPAARKASLMAMVAFNRASAKSHSGVWRDLAVHRRATEVDAMLGLVVARGAAHGLRSSVLARLVAMIHEVETGMRRQADTNLDELAACDD